MALVFWEWTIRSHLLRGRPQVIFTVRKALYSDRNALDYVLSIDRMQ